MLNIFYGDMPQAIYNTAVYFKNIYGKNKKKLLTKKYSVKYFHESVFIITAIAIKTIKGASTRNNATPYNFKVFILSSIPLQNLIKKPIGYFSTFR